MGNVRLGVPETLVLKLRDAFGVTTFIETGTYKAGSTLWAAQHFPEVYTIEGWKDYYERAKSAHAKDNPNIQFIFGDSRIELPKVLAQVDKPAIIWLDAHWLGDGEMSKGTDGECPIREELEALNACPIDHLILIDDARLFQRNLPPWADPLRWPGFEEVKAALEKRGRIVHVFEDVIIAVPPWAEAVVREYVKYPGMRVAVLTSNDYVKILPGFSLLFNRYWSDKQIVSVMRYDVRPPKLPPNFHNIAVGYQADYSFTAGLRAFLDNMLYQELVIILLEDYYLDWPVDTRKVQAIWSFMELRQDIMKIDLTADRVKTPHRDYPALGVIGLVESEPDAPFRGSLQAAIWRVSYLKKHLAHDWTPWQFERHACNDSGLILGTAEPVVHYINAVGGEGHNPGEYDRKKIPGWMWDELVRARVVA